MPQLLLPIVMLFILTACDINESMRAKSSDQSSADIRVLAAKNGCMGCHAVNTTVMGPAWNLVAKRYKDLPGAKGLLIDAVINGGSGNWTKLTGGQVMPPHKEMSRSEVSKIVEYILKLDTPGKTTSPVAPQSEQ